MFAKIFTQVFDSSIAEDWRVRHVFEDLLKLCDADGVVDMTRAAIARRTNVPIKVVSMAITQLEKPDKESRNPDHEGRRIVRLDKHRDWGWVIVNYRYYRNLITEAQRREKARARTEKWRKKSELVTPCDAVVTLGDAPVTPRDVCDARQRQRKRDKYPPLPPTGGSGGRTEPEGYAFAKGRGRPASVDEVVFAGTKAGVSEADCRQWFSDMEQANWCKIDGTPFGNWPRELCIHRDRLRERHERTKNTQRTDKASPSELRNSRIMGAERARDNALAVVEQQRREQQARRAALDAKEAAQNDLAGEVAGPGGDAP